jgi:pyridoxine 5-phosphate synthase
MAGAREIGADRVELYTEPYAAAFARDAHTKVLPAFRDAALAAKQCGLGINAGHDLNLLNLGPFLREVPDVLEVSIGHALVADALEYGLAETVRRYLAIVRAA